MEEVLGALARTKVELAIHEEESQAKRSLLRALAEENSQMASRIEKLLSEKRLLSQDLTSITGQAPASVCALSRTYSEGPPLKQGRDSLETQADSPRLGSDGTEKDPGLASKCRHVLTNWNKFKHSAKLKKLIRRGFAKELRGELWKKVIGNLLNLQDGSLEQYASLALEGDSHDYRAIKLIPLDVRRTLTYLQTFQEDQPLHKPLKSLLSAFAGMAYLGAVLLLHLQPQDAFSCFSNLIVRSQLLFDCYSFDVAKIQVYYQIIDTAVKDTIPKVWQKLKALAVTPEMYLLEWLFTMFVRCVKIEDVSVLWDFLLTEGDSAFLRTAVAVLSQIQAAILAANVDTICRVFEGVPQLVGDVRDVVKACSRVVLKS